MKKFKRLLKAMTIIDGITANPPSIVKSWGRFFIPPSPQFFKHAEGDDSYCKENGFAFNYVMEIGKDFITVADKGRDRVSYRIIK